jgi:hypothetical protein
LYKNFQGKTRLSPPPRAFRAGLLFQFAKPVPEKSEYLNLATFLPCLVDILGCIDACFCFACYQNLEIGMFWR